MQTPRMRAFFFLFSFLFFYLDHDVRCHSCTLPPRGRLHIKSFKLQTCFLNLICCLEVQLRVQDDNKGGEGVGDGVTIR
ncbi:hypothetical protein BC939DRAFT_44300 [Gamsiella multidivaricata]|uniref:uncharacterized protein n=1 Tax=Gamsiella multidivaricata TaxID=101098 RepID=UPI0022211259|nr:uncharacterized protein BC939DRAFT_44300 [Gamsiella multidivaricata]KAI7816417.1 hypothetical protein BC939DRAFT_44300 [Gamsiella multidivaricata]